jgi:hypothetical protein
MMKKLDGWQYPLLFLVVAIFAGVLYLHFPKPADWPAWVQAVGSVIGIGIAIYVPNRQIKIAREQDLAETRAFVQAIREELGTLWLGYSTNLRPHLHAVKEKDFLRLSFPMSTEAFTIYNGSSSRVGKVSDAELRRLIVAVYANAKGLIFSYQMNNKMLVDLDSIESLYSGSLDARLSAKWQHLVDYAIGLKQLDCQFGKNIEAFFASADSWLEA